MGDHLADNESNLAVMTQNGHPLASKTMASTKTPRFSNPPGKIALKPSEAPAKEALDRIASAVNKARRSHEESEENGLLRHGIEAIEERQKNGRYIEIPQLLDGFRMLNCGPAESPEDIYSIDISGRDLRFVLEDDLSMFTKLQTLKAGENMLPLARLGVIPNLRKLILPCNAVSSLDLDMDGRFVSLEYLDLSYNALHDSGLLVLATLPSLRYLDLTRNEIYKFPSTIKDMSRWRDTLIELLFPAQVAALNAGKSSESPEPTSRPLTRRSFARSMASRPKTQGLASRLEGQVTETLNEVIMKKSLRNPDSLPDTPSDSSRAFTAPHRQSSPLTIGYPNLQTLILEGNHISTPDVFDVLGALPNLVNLNLNNNHIQSLNYFLPHGESLEKILAEDPSTLTKYSGFQKLEELSLKNNQIGTMESIVGLICLPCLKRVFLGGNHVISKVNFKALANANGNFIVFAFRTARANKNLPVPNPFGMFSKTYKISIVDLPKIQFIPSTNVVYSVAPTRYGPAVVKLSKLRQKPCSIGKILRRNVPAVVRGNRHVVEHKVSEGVDAETYKDRRDRRMYSFTDEDIVKIIRMGRIPKIRDLHVVADVREEMERDRRRQMGIDGLAESTTSEMDASREQKPSQRQAKTVTFDSTKKDSTFITGVHIMQQMPEDGGEQSELADHEKDPESEDDSDDDDPPSDHEDRERRILPLNIQAAVRALRHALSNPVSYWRIMEESYLRPTAAFQNRFKEVIRHAKNSFDSPNEGFLGEKSFQDEQLEDLKTKRDVTSFPSPANTIATPILKGRERVEYEIKIDKLPEKYSLKQPESEKFEDLVSNKLMLDAADQQPSTLSYIRKVRNKKNGLARAKQAGHFKPSSDFDEMTDMMADVDRKLKLIEADLAAVLGSSSMRKRIPQSQKLLNEIQEEYARIESSFLADAAVRIHENRRGSEYYDLDQEADEYVEDRLGSSSFE